nr:transposase, MuDR, MULE transposase domain protein [Tanacetum cinerariifolium]
MANEGTVTHIETGAEGRFKLLYIGFGVAIRVFLTSMRPLIIIDRAHLKGTYEGMNLLTVGMDVNNQIVPIATGVCQGGESTKAWSFFLSKLKESICLVQDMTIISNRQQDLDCHKCTCQKWQLSKLPYGHVIATSVYLKLTNYCLFSKHWFRKTTVRETYKELMYPLQKPSSWETPADKQNVFPPMMEKWTPGRPSNNDCFWPRGESRDKTPCGTCGKKGNKSMSCKGPKKIQSKRQQKIKMDFEEDDVIGGNQLLARLFFYDDDQFETLSCVIMSSSRKTPICEAEVTKMEANKVKKEHIDMNPEKIAEQNKDTYGPTYVDPDCYYEEADAIKEV